MKVCNLFLAVVGLLVIVAACKTIETGEGGGASGDPRARYLVVFGTSTARIKVKPGFKDALKKASWWKDISFTHPKPNDPPTDSLNPPNLGSQDNTLTINQDTMNNPNNQQVTQRVGFQHGQEQQLFDLLKLIDDKP